MITDLKIYIIIALTVAIGILCWQLNSVKTEFHEYQENIHDQIQQAIVEKKRIEAEQLEKFRKAELDYADARKQLSDALKRLRDAQTMSGSGTMPVAGNSASAVPGTPANTTGATDTIEITAGTGSFTYENAMMDTLQCSRLIAFIK